MLLATRPRPASQTLSRPPERVSEAGILFRGALSVLPQNVRETAVFAPEYEANVDASGYVPGAGCGFRARVRGEGDGVCEGKREREKWIQDYAVERGCAPGRNLGPARLIQILFFWCGQDT